MFFGNIGTTPKFKKKKKVLNTSTHPAKYQMTNLFFSLLLHSYGIVSLIKALFKVTKKSSEAVHLLMLWTGYGNLTAFSLGKSMEHVGCESHEMANAVPGSRRLLSWSCWTSKIFLDICKKTLANLLKSYFCNPNVLNRCVGKVQAPVMGFTYLLWYSILSNWNKEPSCH